MKKENMKRKRDNGKCQGQRKKKVVQTKVAVKTPIFYYFFATFKHKFGFFITGVQKLFFINGCGCGNAK